jgi:hypothetical protein
VKGREKNERRSEKKVRGGHMRLLSSVMAPWEREERRDGESERRGREEGERGEG